MSVIEIGSYELRGGYIGDSAPFFRRPSLWCNGMEDVGDCTFSSLLRFTSSPEFYEANKMGAPPSASFTSSSSLITPMWNTSSFLTSPKLHGDALHRCRRHLLGCTFEESEPLMLVVPEVWHESFSVMELLAETVLEGGVASSFYCCRPSVAVAFREGRASAVITDFGFSHLTTAAVLDGQTLRHSIVSAPFGSAAVRNQLLHSMSVSLEEGREEENNENGEKRSENNSSSGYLPRAFPHLSSIGQQVASWEVSRTILQLRGSVVTKDGAVEAAAAKTSSCCPPLSVPVDAATSAPAAAAFGGMGGQTTSSDTGPQVSSLVGDTPLDSRFPPSFRTPDGSLLHLTPEQCTQPYEMYFGGMTVEEITRYMTTPMVSGIPIHWQQSEGWRWEQFCRMGKEREGNRDHRLCSSSFSPSSSSFHVADMIVGVKQGLDPEWQASALPHIFTGGISVTPGFFPRLKEELRNKDAAYGRYAACGALQLSTHAGGGYAAFTGASLVALSSSFFPLWIRRSEWEEEGLSVLFRKFFY